MTLQRRIVAAAAITLAMTLLPGACSAQSVGMTPAVQPAAEQQWAAVQCASCQKAGFSVQFRNSPNENGEAGPFIIARLRNHTERELVGSIEVLDAELPDSEGHIPSQTLWFVLGPSGNERGEAMILLRRRAPVQVVAHSVAQW